MGRKVRWFDTVQRILSTSEAADPVGTTQTDGKAAKLRDKPSFKKIWPFGKSSSSGASTSAAPAAPDAAPHHPQLPESPGPDQQQAEIIPKVQLVETSRREEGDQQMCPPEEVVSPASEVSATPAPMAAAAAIADPTVTSPTAWTARSKEDIAATRIQAACRGYLARRAHEDRGMARLTSLVQGFAVRRQTEEALCCMQAMTRIQTQIYSRRLKTEEDNKALKRQTKVKQSLDKIKIGEGWDHSLQSKEQMEAVLTMKQEAASRRQRALSYAFSQQWRNRNPSSSSARAAPAPMFMNPGNPNWGWSWTERWMAAARPWENQTTAAPDNGRAAVKSAGGRRPRMAVSIQIPTASTTTTTPKGKGFRPPSWPSLPSPSTPPPRSPSLSGRTAMLASPRSGPLHAASGLQRTKSLQPDRRPRSSQELSSASSPRRTVPASPKGGRSGSPLHASTGMMQHVATTQPGERRPRSSQDRGVSSPRLGAKDVAPLRRTTSLRADLPRRLNLGSNSSSSCAAVPAAGDDAGAPVTPSYMQPTKSVKAKVVRCPSPSALATADMSDAPENGPAPPLQVPSPSSAKKRMPLAFADKPSPSSPSKVMVERARRNSQPPSPRMPLP